MKCPFCKKEMRFDGNCVYYCDECDGQFALIDGIWYERIYGHGG